MFWIILYYIPCFNTFYHVIKSKFVFSHFLLSMLSYSYVFFLGLSSDTI